MNGKGFIQGFKRFLFYGCFMCLFLIVFGAGCTTTGQPTDNSVIEHQRRIVELESRVRDYEERLGQYDSLITGTQSRLEAVRRRADSITDRVDRLIFLFSEYEREVQRLLDEGDTIGGEGKNP